MSSSKRVVLAIAAHPDDIEFYMAGTLLLLKEEGFAVHYMTLASGSCGSMEHSVSHTRRVRAEEAKEAAKILGAEYHPPLFDDLEIFFELKPLRRLAALVREIGPSILLTHSPQDYMEDHKNTCRLAVTAAFARGMPNFKTQPSKDATDQEVTVYHAMPHGLRDELRQRVTPASFVDTTTVQELKREALAAHRSQKTWLDVTQGLGSYLSAMDEMSLEVGKMSRWFAHAEGWRRRLHLGYCSPDADPLKVLGNRYLINAKAEAALNEARTVSLRGQG